jgi:hypothetical protein
LIRTATIFGDLVRCETHQTPRNFGELQRVIEGTELATSLIMKRYDLAIAMTWMTLGCTEAAEDGTGGDASGGTTSAGPQTSTTSTSSGVAMCDAGETICEGACVAGSCDFAVTKVETTVSAPIIGTNRDWVSGGGTFRIEGRGFDKLMKLRVNDGRAALKVIDATRAIMKVPAGFEGDAEIHLELNGKESTSRGIFGYVTETIDPNTAWEQVAMAEPRFAPTTAVLHDGRLLIAGGWTGFSPVTATASAETYAAGAIQTEALVNRMLNKRVVTPAATLLDGAVLFPGGNYANYGGWCCDSSSECCAIEGSEFFQPEMGTFVAAPQLQANTLTQVSHLMGTVDGLVLMRSKGNGTDSNGYLYELYDPELGSAVHGMGGPDVREGFQATGAAIATTLRDGRILFVQGQGRDVFLWNPEIRSWERGGRGPLAGPDALITLPDGRVLAIGGSVVEGNDGFLYGAGGTATATDRIEIYDPATGDFTLAPFKLPTPRAHFGAVHQRDGSILIVGGEKGYVPFYYSCAALNPGSQTTAEVERLDPMTGTFTDFADLPEPLAYPPTHVLADGSAVVVGGSACNGVEPSKNFYFRKANPIPK